MATLFSSSCATAKKFALAGRHRQHAKRVRSPESSFPMNPRKYWRSLDQLCDTPEFQRWLRAEFPEGVSETASEIHRRDFLRLMGASLALAGVGACTKQPIEKIVPYVNQPEEVVLGKPLRFASATTFGGYGQGVLVTSYEGRPTKMEGNPDHWASRGATSIWGQADVLDLYDPDRAQSVTNGGEISTWGIFLQQLNFALVRPGATGGAGLRFLTQTITSPTLIAQLQTLMKKFPGAKLHSWESLTRDSLGKEPIYDFTKAKVIVALDSDFLYLHPAALAHARDFSAGRRVTDSANAQMSRFYAAEPTPTVTGSNADHRLPLAARDIGTLAKALAARLGISSAENPTVSSDSAKWLDAATRDLLMNRGASVLIAGETQPPEVHALVQAMNAALGNVGITVTPQSAAVITNQLESFRTLVDEMTSGAVEWLVILGGNPVFDSPADIDFAGALEKVKMRVHHTLHANETSRHCQWTIPATHFLETWSDVRALDGTATIVQPLIEPLYAGISAHELVEAFVRQPVRSAYEIVRTNWQGIAPVSEFERAWRKALSDGVIEKPPRSGGFQTAEVKETAIRRSPLLEASPANQLEIAFRADPNILDGRYANNAWLQELPKPFSKITWDNAALVSPKLAQRENLQNGDYIELIFRGRKLDAPICIIPGQAENSITLHLGYGRQHAGRVGTNKGYNAYTVRTSDALWFGNGVTIRKISSHEKFATTQNHFAIEGRHMFRGGTLAGFLAEPDFAEREAEVPKHDETLYNPDEFKNAGYAWGMVVDLNTCIGCSACTIACQAENNIPVVGKAQVIAGREMHWIRVDNYFEGSPDNPAFHHQPVPCMHCEHAPCELVCPVGATVHDDEGLNLQVYNRCVGTRYCSNNCPYKVRRFNFLEYNGNLSASEKLVKNPDVTVRSRGVMEKCTYCLQRINQARYAAELDNNRRIRDGEITPACAQVCPVEAITFGDIHDPHSRVSKLKRSPLNYGMLAELNTRPRTSYFAKLRNPNPEMT